MKRNIRLLSCLWLAFMVLSIFSSKSFADTINISSIKNMSITVYQNTDYALPKMIDAKMSDHTTQKVPISWDPKVAATQKAGTYVYKGIVKGYAKNALLIVTVVASRKQTVASTAKFGLPEATTGSGITNPKADNANAAKAQEKAISTKDMEILKAISLGLVPENLQGSWDDTITYRQYCQMLSNVIAKYDSTELTKWNKLISAASVSDDPMHREDGILAMSHAAVMLSEIGLDYAIDKPLDISQQEMDEQIKHLSWNYQYFPDWDHVVYPYNKCNYMWGGVQFFSQKRSLVSLNAIYPYDLKEHSMHLDEPLTRHDAIQAVLRFYESMHRKVDAESAKSGTLSDQAIALAQKMPTVSNTTHPNWYGRTMDLNNLHNRKGREYTIKEDLSDIAGMGFNYLRLMLVYEDFTEDKNGSLVFYQDMLENIDRIMEWCAEYKIHLCIDMHELPGYSSGYPDEKLNILQNRGNYQKALLIWNVLSARYAQVPSNLLSYNLVNEPGYNYFTEENYAAFAKDMISVIRSNDKTNKQLVSDGMFVADARWPGSCPFLPNKLLSNDIVQTFHLYPYTRNSTYLMLEQWPFEHAQPVSNLVNEGTSFKLNGDFKAGTLVTLYIDTVYGLQNKGGSILCKADGNDMASFPTDGFTVGKDNCTSIHENIAEFGDNGRTNGWSVELKVTSPCREISISPQGGAGFSLHELFIKLPSDTEHTYGVPMSTPSAGFVYETGKYTTVYLFCANVFQNKTSSIDINPDGSYSVENPADCTMFDYDSLKAYIKSWADWSKSTGTQILCNEFGIPVSLSEKARISYMRSVLELFKQYNISWSIFSDDWQCWAPIVADASVKMGGTILPADGSLVLKNGFWYDQAMLDLLREYMK